MEKKKLINYLKQVKEEMNLLFFQANLIDLMQSYNALYDEILKEIK